MLHKDSDVKWDMFIDQSDSQDTLVFVEVDLSNTSETKKVINRHMVNCRIVTVRKRNNVACTSHFII